MSNLVKTKTDGDTSWFTNDRFGMFIHFGLYAMGARHEWLKRRESVSEEKYDKYFHFFNPDLFDAKEWAKKAKAAGMKYVVLTAKHHEGFCNFDSKYTDYKITNTPFGRDLVREYVDAFRAEGLKIGFYYSLIDWHHPEFPIDVMHPRKHDDNAEELDRGRDMKKYAEYMRNQVTELLTNYGKIDILWFDFSYTNNWTGEPAKPWMQFEGLKGPEQWEADKMIKLIRSIQPDIILNNRIGVEQDIRTPEQYQPDSWAKNPATGEYIVWEACQTLSGSWGYYRDEHTWKTPEMLVNMLVDTVACGGNLIMNIGPTARGNFDSRADNALETYANWMKFNSRSIYGCTCAAPEFENPTNGTKYTLSEDGKRLYVHLQKYPFGTLKIKGLAGKIEYAQFLHDASEILYDEITVARSGENNMELAATTGDVIFKLPTPGPDVISPVIEIYLK